MYGAEKSGKKSKEKVKVPTTAEEVKRLRETEKLFHSNLYRLQIEEMLKEVKLKAKYLRKFDEWLPLLESALVAMEDSEEHDVNIFYYFVTPYGSILNLINLFAAVRFRLGSGNGSRVTSSPKSSIQRSV